MRYPGGEREPERAQEERDNRLLLMAGLVLLGIVALVLIVLAIL